MFQNGQKVVVVSSGDPARVIKVQAASSLDTGRYPTVDTTGVTGRDQQVQIVSGGDETRFPKLQGLADARSTADSVITALTPAAWYRNATGVTSAGGFASQWDDYSGNGRHLVQATGTNQPAYAAGVFTFDGADNFLKASTFTLNQPVTVIARLSLVSWAVSDRICDGFNASSLILWETTSTPRISLYAGATAAAENAGLTIGGWDVVVGFFSGASSYLKINTNAATTGNPGTGASGGFTLGGSPTGTSAANVSVKEVVLVNAEVTEPSLTALINALAAI